jgi:general secretion pathway protein I
LSRSTAVKPTTAGFTLVEVLVALAIVAIALSSIGALIATTVRGTRSIEQYLNQLGSARAVIAALPDRDQLVLGNFSGELAGHRWRVDVSPFIDTEFESRQPTPWVPRTVVVTVQSPTGRTLYINTVRLQRRAGG